MKKISTGKGAAVILGFGALLVGMAGILAGPSPTAPVANATPPAAPTPASTPPPVKEPPPSAPIESPKPPAAPPATPHIASYDVYYANCMEARDAGAAPIYEGEPGYSSKLDRDGDGVACE